MAKKTIKPKGKIKEAQIPTNPNPFEDEEIVEETKSSYPDVEELTKQNPLFERMEKVDFENETLKGVCMTLALLYHDFNKKKRLQRLKAIIINTVEIYPADRAKVKAVFKKDSKAGNPNPPTVRHGVKNTKGKIVSSANSGCVDCPQVQEVEPSASFKKIKVGGNSDGKNLTFGTPKADKKQAAQAFITVADTLERFTEKETGEANIIAMKVFCQNENIQLHPQASKPETIAKAIVKHFKEKSEESDSGHGKTEEE